MDNKKLTKLETISSRLVITNPYWDYKIDKYSYPAGGEGEYHYVHSKGATMVVPVLNDKIIMVSQYRYLNQRNSLEFPGGGIKPGLEPEQNAREELAEEAGYKAGEMAYAGGFNPFNGVTNEICHVFIARGLQKTAARPDESEEFFVELLTEKEIERLIKSGDIWDGMTLAAWSLFR
ncbi:MAG: NUDIX domain-containing protein, partial [Bacteroidota bacterium]